MVVAQMKVDSDGILQTVDPGPPIDPDEGANFDGTTVQFGLTEEEVNAIWERVEALIEKVDANEIALF